MNFVILQEKLLTLTSFIYLAAAFCYIFYLGKRSEGAGKAASYIGLAGAVTHTFGLVFRWIAAGWSHPPFTNLYESLVFFGWGIVVFYLYVEWRHKVRIAGAFVFPIALAAMGIAVTHQKDIMPLPDALKSWWLHIHVMFASIAYAAFVVAFAFSLMFLIKDKVHRSVFGIVSSAIVGICLLLVQLRAGTGHLTTFFMKKAEFYDGKWLPVPIADAEPVEYMVRVIPFVGPMMLLIIALLVIAGFAFAIYSANKNEAAEKAGGYLHAIASALLLLAVTIVSFNGATLPDVSLRIEPFLLALLGFLVLISVGATYLFFRGENLVDRLPAVNTLDFLSYRSVMVAFPLMTIVIITGAVWAQSAWGRYWGWDPKETASLVTWFVYAVYLHMRVVAGWKERPSAIINMVGFLSVIFTYLGVNVFLSGLHSYASSF